MLKFSKYCGFGLRKSKLLVFNEMLYEVSLDFNMFVFIYLI